MSSTNPQSSVPATLDAILRAPFAAIPDMIRAAAQRHPERAALIHDDRRLNYAGLDALLDRIAARLQRDGLKPRDSIAICATTSIEYAAVFLGGLRAGLAVAPLATTATPDSLANMIADSDARLLFVDRDVSTLLAPVATRASVKRIALDGSDVAPTLDGWLAPPGSKPAPVAIDPSWTFNVIYSSGTTGQPKGIEQPHQMRWGHVQRGVRNDYDADAITLISTPLYSNTTLVSFFPTLALGGTVVLMAKFDAAGYLALAEKHRVTHAMLVPVQYQRLMALPDFDRYDLSSFRCKYCTSAPFPAALKADILKRWPGGLVEIFGMTEGGGVCILEAHKFPNKLHTVGRPPAGHDIRVIDDQGNEVPRGELGEVVGSSGAIMTGYRHQPSMTREAEWYDPNGKRFIRTGDVGRFDEDGFMILMDRKKDMIISGGFNIYPSDLEAVARAHPEVAEVAVVGVPSSRWGETPVAFVVLKAGAKTTGDALRAWINDKLGKTQRLAALELCDSLPRGNIGKVLKRELRDAYKAKIGVLP
ncbi:MAG TPA: class I adenylate-forming enzyme family protein [Burkholderiales bacterium]|nr:class I adenylate-forming enzyme family protein [Burkholderiales bacterium]